MRTSEGCKERAIADHTGFQMAVQVAKKLQTMLPLPLARMEANVDTHSVGLNLPDKLLRKKRKLKSQLKLAQNLGLQMFSSYADPVMQTRRFRRISVNNPRLCCHFFSFAMLRSTSLQGTIPGRSPPSVHGQLTGTAQVLNDNENLSNMVT